MSYDDWRNEDEATKRVATAIHLSQLLGLVLVPIFGSLVPLLIWQIKRRELPGVDVHGRNVANWILTQFVLATVFGVLTVVLIGFPLLALLYVIGVISPIIGASKARNGEVWRYPFAFRFFD